MRESFNRVVICGKVLENNIEKKVSQKGEEYISGNVVIRVHQKVGREVLPMEIPVEVYSKKYRKDGEPNKVYKGLEEAMNSLKSIAAVGQEEASNVVVANSGKPGTQILRTNMYISRGTQQLVQHAEFSSNFINPTSQGAEEAATFEVDIVVTKKGYILDSEGVETDKYEVEGVHFGYNGRANIQKFVITDPQIIDYFEQNINLDPREQDSIKVSGIMNYSVREEVTVKKVAVGSDIQETRTFRTRELVITGLFEPYEGDEAFPAAEVKKALAEREIYIEELKAKSEDRATSGQFAEVKQITREEAGF